MRSPTFFQPDPTASVNGNKEKHEQLLRTDFCSKLCGNLRWSYLERGTFSFSRSCWLHYNNGLLWSFNAIAFALISVSTLQRDKDAIIQGLHVARLDKAIDWASWRVDGWVSEWMSGVSVWVSYWVSERASQRGRKGGSERASQRGREGGREGAREGGREVAREGGRERGSEGGTEGGSEGRSEWVSERVVGTPFGCQFSLSGVVYQLLKNSERFHE